MCLFRSYDILSQVSSGADPCKDESVGVEVEIGAVADGSEGGDVPEDDVQHLVKLSYHDSGIDIRDPLLNANVTPANSKKVSTNIKLTVTYTAVLQCNCFNIVSMVNL